SCCPVESCPSLFRAKRRDVTIRQHLQMMASRGSDAHRQVLAIWRPRRPQSPRSLSKSTTRRWRQRQKQVAIERARQERGNEFLAPLYDSAKLSTKLAAIKSTIKRKLDEVPYPKLPDPPVYTPCPTTSVETNFFYLAHVHLHVHWGSGFRGTDLMTPSDYETSVRSVLATAFTDTSNCKFRLLQVSRANREPTQSKISKALAAFDSEKSFSKAVIDFRAWFQEDERRRTEYRLRMADYDREYEFARQNRVRWEAQRLPESIEQAVQEQWQRSQLKLETKLL
ncbi:hypothetical protein V1511DRAFT_444576, partial [Dipodascopsis uninucleata]